MRRRCNFDDDEGGDFFNDEKEEQTHLINEEGGEAKDSLLLNNRACLFQAGNLQLPGWKKLERLNSRKER